MKFLKDFVHNFKNYLKYLMRVGFKELLINVLLLICILLLACLVYVPIGVLQELIRSFIVIYATFEGTGAQLFYWFFSFISAVCAFLVFIYLFNLRFQDIEAFKEQMQNDSGKKDNNKNVSKEEPQKGEEEEIVLPKAKKD